MVSTKHWHATTLCTLINRLVSKDDAVTLLCTTANEHNCTLFVNISISLAIQLQLSGLPKRSNLSAIVRHITDNSSQCPPNICSAVPILQDEHQQNRQLHQFLADRFRLSHSTGQSWVQTLPKHPLERQTHPYPLFSYFASESQEIRDKWGQRLLQDPQQDRWQPWCLIHDLQPSKLLCKVPSDERCVLIDSGDRSIITVMLRGVMQEDNELQAGFLAWAVEMIQNGIAG